MFGPMGLLLRAAVTGRVAPRPRIQLPNAAPSAARLATIRELAERGVLKPIIDRSYPLEKAAEAIRYVETEHARAKVILTVAA